MTYTASAEFSPHLLRWGPGHAPCASLEEAMTYCRSLATKHYENFPVLTIALPRRLRQPMCNVYAFCRWSDDLGDEVADTEASLELLAWWRAELDACYNGIARHPVFMALAESISEFDLPKEPLSDLISAFEQDQTVRRYDTRQQLRDYCKRSANPVGRMVLRLFGEDSPAQIEMSDRVCTGLQLINFWQDVARDADIGRTYIPAETREGFGYDDSMLEARSTNDEFLALMHNLVDDAKSELVVGEQLAATLSGRLRVAMEMFYRGGLKVAERIEANGFRCWDQRPVVSKVDFLRILVSSVAGTARRTS